MPFLIRKKPLVTCVIVCFNGGERLEKVVSLTLEQVNDIIIVDNNSKSETKAILCLLRDKFPGRVAVIFNAENYWFGKAMNIGIKEAILKGPDYILQLNDDTFLGKNSVHIMLECFGNASSSPIGIVSPSVLFDDFSPADTIEKTRDEPLIPAAGMLIPLEVFKKIGLYDEDLVIGYEDYDLSLRVVKNGYRCLVSSRACLHARLGRMEIKNVLWKKFMVFHYSPIRRYYAARNGLYLLLRWKKSYALLRSVYLWERNSILGIILFETNKFEKVYLTLLGYFDALCGKMGFKLIPTQKKNYDPKSN